MSIASVTGRWIDRKWGIGGVESEQRQPFEELTAYIPVESITLFVSAVSVLDAASPALDGGSPLPTWLDIWAIYWVFALVVTPAIVLLVARSKWRSANDGGATLPFNRPIWPILSAVAAFLAWAWAVPGLAQADFEKIVAAFAAIFVSRALSLVEGAYL